MKEVKSLVLLVGGFFLGYLVNKEKIVEVHASFHPNIFAVDKKGLLEDLEEAYILGNFETNSLVVLDDSLGYIYNKEAREAGEKISRIYRQLLENNKIELQFKKD